MDAETWRPIPGFPGYDVSDLGRVRSYYKRGKGQGGTHWILADEPQRILRPSYHPGGYPGVGLMQDGQRLYVRTCKLVLLAFVGPCPDGMEVCHNNSDPKDNRLLNLRYDTHLNNGRDRCFRNGQPPEVWMLEARRLVDQGVPLADVAAQFDYSPDILVAHIGPSGQRQGNGILITNALHDEILAQLPHKKQRQLAKEYGVHESTISRWINGSRRAPEGAEHGPRHRQDH